MRRFIVGLVASVAILAGVSTVAPVVHAADCDNNAIIRCGFSGAGPGTINQHFIETVRSNDSGNGHHDLINVYKSYGLDTSQYNDFIAYARQGYTYKNGKIVVDGRVVGTDGNSIGRLRSYQGSGPFSKTIAGNTYWGNTNDQAFLSDPLPVTVLFDSRGAAIFAVINSCGNPVGFNSVTPSYTCTNLKATPESGQPGVYDFKTNASVANGATIQKIVYNFGDGTTATSTSVSQTVTHKYASSGSFKASVRVYVSLPFGHSDILNGADTGCATVIDVKLPVYACLLLQAVPIPDQKFTYQFVVKGKLQNGASLKGASFKFSDSAKSVVVNRASSTTASYTRSFAAGSYTVVATLLINLPDGQSATVTSSKCATTVKAAEYGCLQLTGDQSEDNPLAYHFTVAANATPKLAVFKSADFNFGDGTTANGVLPVGLQAVTDHTYAAQGNYTVTSILHFTVNGKVHDDMCTTPLSPTTECRPGVPQGSPLCTPCQYNPQLPAGSPDCIGTLPNTGAGNTIAIAGVVAVIGFFFYRQFIFRKHVFHSGNGTINMLLGETAVQHKQVKHEMASHNAHHRNKQPLSHAHYQRPHRFRPRSHGDK